MRPILISFLLLFFSASTVLATTLAEITWPTTGTSATAISSDGYFNNIDPSTNPDAYEVYSGGPGGRNYLRLKNPASGVYWLIRTTDTLGNPNVLVTRWWWRVGPNTENSNRHDFIINNYSGRNSHPEAGFWQMLKRSNVPSDGDGNVITIDPLGFSLDGNAAYSWGPYVSNQWNNMTVNQWYMIEYRINQTAGTWEIRIDGVDVTDEFYRYNFGQQSIPLTDDNGSFTFDALNYFKINVYYKETQSTGDMVEDIAGVKITDGPDWIGDESQPIACTISTGDPQAVSSDSVTLQGTCTDAVGVTAVKARLSSAPDASNGTSCTCDDGTCNGTSEAFTCVFSGLSEGANTVYVGGGDAAANWSTGGDADSITVNYTIAVVIHSVGPETVHSIGPGTANICAP